MIRIKFKVFTMAYNIYIIWAPASSLISSPISSSLFILFLGHRKLHGPYSNFIQVSTQMSFIRESFPLNIASAFVTLCTLN